MNTKKQQKATEGEAYLLAEEVARRLRVDLQIVYRWARDKKIPHIRLGKMLRFSENELNEWLKAKRA